MRIGIKPGQWGWSFGELVASWRVADEAGFDVISCFDHVTAQPTGAAAWDAPTLLSAMAGVTIRARLAVDVLNSCLRHPFPPRGPAGRGPGGQRRQSGGRAGRRLVPPRQT